MKNKTDLSQFVLAEVVTRVPRVPPCAETAVVTKIGSSLSHLQKSKMDDEDKEGFLEGVLEEEGKTNRNVLLSYMNVLGGAASKVKHMADVDVWPDVHRVNRLVDVWTVVGYCFGTFTVMGTLYFSLKTYREMFQWRAWMKLRRNRVFKKGSN